MARMTPFFFLALEEHEECVGSAMKIKRNCKFIAYQTNKREI